MPPFTTDPFLSQPIPLLSNSLTEALWVEKTRDSPNLSFHHCPERLSPNIKTLVSDMPAGERAIPQSLDIQIIESMLVYSAFTSVPFP